MGRGARCEGEEHARLQAASTRRLGPAAAGAAVQHTGHRGRGTMQHDGGAVAAAPPGVPSAMSRRGAGSGVGPRHSPPNLRQAVLGQLGDVVEVAVGGVISVHGNHLVVLLAVVHHLLSSCAWGGWGQAGQWGGDQGKMTHRCGGLATGAASTAVRRHATWQPTTAAARMPGQTRPDGACGRAPAA